MTTRLFKEFRGLLLPTAVAAGAACMISLFALFDEPSGGDVWSFFHGLSGFAFLGGIAIAAGMTFGAEFQQRTLSLVLTQPVERSRIWNEKMLALVLSVTATALVLWLSQKLAYVVLIHWPASFPGLRLEITSDGGGALLCGTCVVAGICSASFWTLWSRSTIGGIVFSLTSQFFVALGAVFVLQKIYGPDLSFEEAPVVRAVIIVAGIIYSAVFLWLGRRKFSRLELRDVSSGESDFLSGPVPGTKWWSRWLRCRPAGMTTNLIRKELLLHKPIFLIAAILSLCWLVTVTLLLLDPARKEAFEVVLNLLTVIYVTVLPLLAGCISLGEEKALGLTAWHLTLPVSARRQWLLKLAVSLSVAVVLGFVLPLLLACVTAMKTRVGLLYLMHEKDNGWSLAVSLSGLAFLMSFWAVTLLTNTLRAALASIISLAALVLCCSLGAWCGELDGPLLDGPFQTGLLVVPTAYFQLPIDFFLGAALRYGLPLALFTFVVTILAQSLAQFRRAQTPRKIIWRYCAILAGMVFLLAFWLTDFANSANSLFTSRLPQELNSALASLPLKQPGPPSAGLRTVTLQELEQTGKLSALTKRWLKGASISVALLTVNNGHSLSTQLFPVTIEFPNGRRSQLYSQGPRTKTVTQPKHKTTPQQLEKNK